MADENLRYQIINILEPSANPNNTLYLTINRPVIGIDINSFLLRRYNPNPNFIIVDTYKNTAAGIGGGSGFILPEYSSNELNTKFDEIIQNLTEKGLI